MYIYLSYENDDNQSVFWDDFKVTHSMNRVIQQDDYYPFGLRHNKSSTAANINDFLFNSGSEINSYGNYETPFRQYDPSIGRFNGVDAMSSSFAGMSGYTYAANNPIMANDPTGLYPEWASPSDMAAWAGAQNDGANAHFESFNHWQSTKLGTGESLDGAVGFG